MPKVTILHRDGSSNSYSTYASARTAAAAEDLIQIWANLDEQIVLKNEVDIWVAPGVKVDNSSGATITDNNATCKCNIYGYGKLINSYSSSSSSYVCNFINSASEIAIVCDRIECTGTTNTANPCISSNANKLLLNCNLVYGNKSGGIYLTNANSVDINLRVTRIITGLENDTSTGITALITRGNGFVFADEILCRNLGHCLNHRRGKITASVRSLTNIHNYSLDAATVFISQGDNEQELVLYFDESKSLDGLLGSSSAIAVKEGRGTFIGRRAYSDDVTAIIGKYTSLSDPPLQMNIFCTEILSSDGAALVVNESVSSNFLKIDSIKSVDFVVVVYSNGYGLFQLINSKIVNGSSDVDSQGIGIEEDNGFNMTLQNVKIISGDSEDGRPIYVGHDDSVDARNYGLFTNSEVNNTMVSFLIGDSSNYLYIKNADLA